MFIKKNNQKRIIALLLSLVMIMTMLPVSVYAVDKSATDSKVEEQNYITNNTYKGTEEDFPVLEEETLLRNKFTKHYIDAEGNRYMAVFPEQVHYVENDSWIEIDNTLTLDETAKRYVSNNEKFRTQFSKESDSEQLVTIEDGSYRLSWSISFASSTTTSKEQGSLTKSENANTQKISKSTALVSEVNAAASSKVKNKETISEFGKAISGIRYNGVLGDKVDLRYSVLHGKVEEDVILNSPDGFTSYMLTVDTNGLDAIKREDNSIAFVNAEGETIFTLGAPWMKDSYVSVSDDIEVTVKQKDDVAYIIYAPNLEWLNDESRVYPVLIDPSFTTRFYTSNYEDTYVYTGDSASTTRPTENTMMVGNLSGKQYYAYLKILNIPDLVGGFSADEATLNFWATTTSSPALSVYNVNGDWSPNTITYANQPSASLIKSNQVGEASGSVSKYSVDLTDWLDYILYYYYSLSDYFNSDAWNGFKIGYTTNITGNYTQICSSEYQSTSCRPIITIKYTYWPYDGIEDGAVYSFINSASDKYLTVDSTNMSTGNVYQYTKNSSLSQAFRLDFDETNEGYKIRTMCSNDGYGSCLEVPSYTGTINSSTGYINSNVRVRSDSTSVVARHEWLFEPYEYGDLYKIVLRADPNLALTAYGTSNGSVSGTTPTSAGNVYVSEFTGASNQLWKLESGGIQVITGTNIKEAYEAGETYTISEGNTWQSFCCPVTEFGATVSWRSNFTQSVTVDDVGRVTTGTAGMAMIYAVIDYGDGTYDTYSCTIYVVIDDGTYYLNNVHNNYRLEYEKSTDLSENAIMEAFNSGTGEPTNRFRMFKIKYLGDGIYSVRSMLDCAMGWTRSSSGLVMTTIGPDDNTIPATAKWRIRSNANGYYIHSVSGVSQTITAGSSSGDNITLSSYSSANRLQNWTIKEVSESYHGVTLKNMTNKLVVGESFDFDAVMYSTYTNVNGGDGFTWSVTGNSGGVSINSSTGVLTGTSVGTVTVKVKYKPDSYQEWVAQVSVEIYKKAIIIVPGIMGSQIFADGSITVPSGGFGDFSNTFADGTRLWDPSTSTGQLILVEEKILALECNSSGIEKYSTKVNSPTINQYDLGGSFQYGATDIYRQLYNAMYESFYDDNYDIVFYEYDWRQDPYDTAVELSAFITQKHYGDIVFVSHSMGGLVSSYYLSLGTSQRKSVDKHISVGTPYLGSVEMPYMYVTGNIRDDFFENFIVSNSVQEIAYNLPSIYALFPFEQNWNQYMSYRSSPDVTTVCQDYETTMEVLSRYMPNWNDGIAEDVFSNRARLFRSNGLHITTLVDSYYIIGTGEETTYSTSGLLDNLINPTQFNGFTLSKNNAGDGTVTEYSATIGYTIPEEKTYYKHSSSTKTATHVGMISGEDLELDDIDLSTIEFIVAVVDETVGNYSESQLSNLFGITQ